MSGYDRRIFKHSHLGTMGISYDEIASAVKERMVGLAPDASVNILFGEVSSEDREMVVHFTAMVGGKEIPGKVIFQLLEVSNRSWNGSAILMESRIEIG